jgi:hypothetical protein
MLQDVKDLTSPGAIKGLNTQYNLLALQKDQSPNMMNVKVNYDGSLEKRLGSNTQNLISVTGGSGVTPGFSPTTAGILTDFVGYWPLNESSGNRSDKIGNATLQAVNNPLYESGINKQSALFISSSLQYLKAMSSLAFTANSAFSISSWFYLNSTGGTVKRTIVSKRLPSVTADNTGVLLLHCDGADASTTFTDSSVSNHTMTANGNAKISTTQSKFGGASGLFDGSNSFLSNAGSSDFNLSGDFTFDVQFYANSFSGVIFNAGYWSGDGIAIRFTNSTTISVLIANVDYTFSTSTLSSTTWYHLAIVRNGSNLMAFIDGVQRGSTLSNSTNIASSINLVEVGRDAAQQANYFSGNLDEMRLVKGTAIWTSNFTSPTKAYSAVGAGAYEYSLSVDSDNLVTFEVSSSGLVADGVVKAFSFGTVGTATWYNAICWYDSASAKIGIVVNESFPVIKSYTGGIISGSSLLTLGVENTAHYMDGRIDEVGFWNKKMGSDGIAILYNKGSGNTYQSAYDISPWASFDFGASSIRWLTCAAGTGVYASSNLGINWTSIATDRTATYQYLDRSKNVLIITSNAYDRPLYWAGSVGTYAAIIGTSTPLAKYSINFQGWLILLNTLERKRSFNYIDENFQLSSTGWLNFDLPSSADDEITNVFILRRYLYVSTRYKIYRLSYVGGNPDWQYVEVKGWGFIPRTVKRIVITGNQQGQTASTYSIGEVVVGLTYDRKLRIFDGSGDQILSNNVEKDNGMCEFALDKISYLGSGPLICFAEVDPIPNVYSLCVGIGQDSMQTTHFLNYDGRSQALYPYSNMGFNCMCVAESANRQFLMAFDRAGYCHMMNSGNLDGNNTPINDVFESPLMFDKTPSQSSKGHKTDFFFSSTTSGNIYYQDRMDLSVDWKAKKTFVIDGSSRKLVHYETVDVPETYNTYQFRIGTSSGTNDSWRLQRYDHFTKGLGIGKNY